MQQYMFQNGLLIVAEVCGKKMTGTLGVVHAVIGMGFIVVLLLGQLVLHSMEWGMLSWTLETVTQLELFMLTWMELLLHQHRQTLLA